MTICDHCKDANNYPGPFGVSISTEGWHHGSTDKGTSRWNFDLCKDCAANLKQEIDKLVKSYLGKN